MWFKWTWILWIAVAFFLTIPPFAWHVEVFREHSPEAAVRALPWLPAIFAALIAAAHKFRASIESKYEPLVLLAPAVLLCLLRTPWPFVLAIAFFLSAHGLGSKFVHSDHPLERIPLRFAAGAGVLMFASAILGLLGFLKPIPAVILLLAPIPLNRSLRADFAELLHRYSAIHGLRGPLMSMALVFGSTFSFLGAMWAITPTIAFDPLKMHFASARWYAESGTFTPLVFTPESYYPQGAELLMALVWLPAGGQAAAQLLSPVFLFATLLLLAGLVRKCGVPGTAVIAGLAVALSIPFLHWTAFVAKNDLPLALFLLASLLCLCDKRLIPAACFLALAFNIKHVALFGAVGLTPIFFYQIWKSQRRLKSFAAVAVVFTALGTLSLVRTYLLTGNPLYPEGAARTTQFRAANPRYHSALAPYLTAPWTIHFDGQRAFESSSPNPMGFWLVFFAPAWLLFRRDRTTALSYSLVFCGVYLLYWVSILVIVRYAVAPILILTALTAPGILLLPRWISLPVTYFCFFFSLMVCTLLEVSVPQLSWLAGRSSTAQFLSLALPSYGPLRALEGRTKPGDRIVGIQNCATAYAPRVQDFQCKYMSDLSDSPLRAASYIHGISPAFFILPNSPAGEAILSALPATEIYRDENYRLFSYNKPILASR